MRSRARCIAADDVQVIGVVAELGLVQHGDHLIEQRGQRLAVTVLTVRLVDGWRTRALGMIVLALDGAWSAKDKRVDRYDRLSPKGFPGTPPDDLRTDSLR